MLIEIANALGTALKAISISELQIVPRMWPSPTTPTLDVYPADPALEDAAFGDSELTLWTVRARVAIVDDPSNQDILLKLMEPFGPTSVRAALLADEKLGGLSEGMGVDPPSGFTPLTALDGNYVSCTWRVRVYVNGGIS